MPPPMDRLTTRPSVRGGMGPSSVGIDAVGEIDRRGVVGDGAAVQKVPWLAIGVNRPTAEHAGIEEEEAAFARPADLGVEIGDQHGLAMVDGDLRRTNLNFERHSGSATSFMYQVQVRQSAGSI